MDKAGMKAALTHLDQCIPQELNLLVGGGAAFILAHDIPLTTADMDGIPYKTTLTKAALDPFIKKVAEKLKLPHDWLNHYFATFTYSLPKDYGQRLITVFQGDHLTAFALGKEDLLIMKCFAHRAKDRSHALQLIQKGNIDLQMVAKHLHRCREEGLDKAEEAIDFFYDICERLGVPV